MNDGYKLLYNNLWLINKSRIAKLNPDYTHLPQDIVPVTIPKPVVASNPKPIKITPPELPVIDIPILKQKPADIILNWDKLVSTINNCKLCSLCDNRQNVVIERGNREAKWMFVGEAPNSEDDKECRPFAGQSGQLLDKMIGAMKLDLERDVYICNIVKCSPQSNHNPKANEIAMCKNYLLSQIELVKPNIIIALGRFAIWTLLDSPVAIEKLRGKVHRYNNIPLIATYSPIYLLRNPDAKKDAWDDLQLAMKTKG